MIQSVLSSFLTTLVSDLANDAASVAVRVAVLKGLTYLVDNPLAQVCSHLHSHEIKTYHHIHVIANV